MDACGCDRGFEIFDRRSAEGDLERYRSKGPDTTTRMLLDLIRARGVRGASILDIGSGIGVIDHELLRDGAGHAVLVEASGPSLEAARNEARRRGHLDRVDFVDGDFVSRASSVDVADIVTLDRVICCYPDMESLVGRSAERARRVYALVYPQDRWWVGLGIRATNLCMRVSRRAFRAYVHRTKDVDAVARAHGLAPRVARRAGPIWQVAVYVRVSD
jgi:magnesium-protoporphyrin O-methyltransferase